MDHIIALDQGTTNTRAVVFDGAGHVVGMAQRELQQLYPHEGWVEHDPLAIREDQFIAARTAIHNAGISGRDLLAIGITNQRETTILWDRRTGEPVSNALVWQDRRTTALCDAIRSEGAEELVRAKTGLTINPYFSASKIRWLLDHTVGLRKRAERGDIASMTTLGTFARLRRNQRNLAAYSDGRICSAHWKGVAGLGIRQLIDRVMVPMRPRSRLSSIIISRIAVQRFTRS